MALEDYRIDYILAPAGGAYETRLAGFDEDHGRPPSDHFAVISDIPLSGTI